MEACSLALGIDPRRAAAYRLRARAKQQLGDNKASVRVARGRDVQHSAACRAEGPPCLPARVRPFRQPFTRPLALPPTRPVLSPSPASTHTQGAEADLRSFATAAPAHQQGEAKAALAAHERASAAAAAQAQAAAAAARRAGRATYGSCVIEEEVEDPAEAQQVCVKGWP
jgi:hypothetical protein